MRNIINPARELRDAALPEFKNGVTIRSILWAATGLGALSAAVRGTGTALGHGKEAFSNIRRRLSRTSNVGISAAIVDPAARFEAACRLHAVSSRNLPDMQARADTIAQSWTAVAMICAAFAPATYYRGEAAASLVLAVIMPTAIAFAMVAGFHGWQMRTRRLGSVREWVALTPPWVTIPLGFFLTTLAAWLVFRAAITPAAAQGVSASGVIQSLSTAPAAADEGAKWIRALIPDGSTATPLTLSLGFFNRILFTVGACGLVPYFALHGLVATAHEGQFLGRKYHDIWGPIRIAIAVGLLAPVGANGLSVADGLMVELATLSTRAGNAVESVFVQSIADGIPLNPAAELGITPMAGAEIARRVLTMEVCRGVIAQSNANNTTWLTRTLWGTPIIPPLPDVPGVLSTPIAPTPVYAGGTSATPTADQIRTWDYGDCGSVAVPLVASTLLNADEVTFDNARATAMSALVGAVRSSGLVAPIVSSQQYGGSAPVNWPSSLVGPLLAPGAAYESTMANAGQAFAKSKNGAFRNALVTDVNGCGWMCLTSYYRTFTALDQERINLELVPPAWRAPVPTVGEDGKPLRRLPADQKDAARTIAYLDQQWAQEVGPGALTGTTLAGPADADSDMLTRILGPLTKPWVQAAIQSADVSTTDGVGGLAQRGHLAIAAAETTLGVGVTVAAATGNVIGSAAGAGTVFQFLSPWINAAAGAMLAIGIGHAFVLPSLPAIQGLWANFTWIVLFAEGLIGIKILCFLAMRLDGDELISDVQRPGMMLVLGLLLRPMLTVLGFEFCYSLLPPVLSFLQNHFATAFLAASGGHVSGVATAIAGFMMQGYLAYQAVTRISGLINVVPDRVLAWIGTSGAEGLGAGDTASQTHAAAEGASTLAAGAAGASLGRGGGGGSGGGGGGPKRDPGGLGGSGRSNSGGMSSGSGETSGGSGEASRWWAGTSGGMGGLTESQQAAARESHAAWQEDGGQHGLESYVSYVQGKQIERRGRA